MTLDWFVWQGRFNREGVMPDIRKKVLQQISYEEDKHLRFAFSLCIIIGLIGVATQIYRCDYGFFFFMSGMTYFYFCMTRIVNRRIIKYENRHNNSVEGV